MINGAFHEILQKGWYFAPLRHYDARTQAVRTNSLVPSVMRRCFRRTNTEGGEILNNHQHIHKILLQQHHYIRVLFTCVGHFFSFPHVCMMRLGDSAAVYVRSENQPGINTIFSVCSVDR